MIPLQPLVDADIDDELLAWDDIPDGIKRKNSWAGQTYTYIVDNDNQTMFYRKDILSDPQWQEAFNAATGKDLPNPPQTLTDFIEVAKFFSPNGGGAAWSDAGTGYGFITCVLRGAQSYWYSYPWTAPYSVLPTDVAPDGTPGIYIFDPDMNPLINTEGYVRGVTEFVDVIQGAMKPGLDADRTTVIEDIINGTTLMSLDWGDTGPASVAERSVVKNKLGFALTPGVTEYFDWMNKTWVTMPEGEIHQTPTHAYNGWSYYITSQTPNVEAAWEWIKFARQPRYQRHRRGVSRLRLPAVAEIACRQTSSLGWQLVGTRPRRRRTSPRSSRRRIIRMPSSIRACPARPATRRRSSCTPTRPSPAPWTHKQRWTSARQISMASPMSWDGTTRLRPTALTWA